MNVSLSQLKKRGAEPAVTEHFPVLARADVVVVAAAGIRSLSVRGVAFVARSVVVAEVDFGLVP